MVLDWRRTVSMVAVGGGGLRVWLGLLRFAIERPKLVIYWSKRRRLVEERECERGELLSPDQRVRAKEGVRHRRGSCV